MAARRKPARQIPSTGTTKREGLDTFTQQVGEALKHFIDPAALGEESPLASVYVLGQRLRSDSALERGRALQRVLLESAIDLADANDPRRSAGERLQAHLERSTDQQQLWYQQQVLDYLRAGNRMQRLLYWSFFHEPRFTTIEPILDHDKIDLPRATYYRQLPKTIYRLAIAVTGCIRPALHLEAPPQPRTMIGRDTAMQTCRQALGQQQTVALIGPGGIGKTAFGAALVASRSHAPTFWFTIRPGLNDHPHTLLLELAAFLHQQGASGLWLQLIADHGRSISYNPTTLLLADLASLPTPPWLCIDEIDLLHPADVEAHSQILTLLESLRGGAPILVMGQQTTLASDVSITLAGLTPDQIASLMASAGVTQDTASAQLLYTHTGGNPRLLHLLIALNDPDISIIDTLRELGNAPSTEALLDRIRRRLSDDERTLLMHLAVFRRATPRDAWARTPPDRSWHDQTLESLIARHLVQADQQGGVAILPVFRVPLYTALQADVRHALHLKAAIVRTTRGEYTAAAFHYLRADQPHVAINLWHQQSTQELNQGQGHSALALFSEIARTQLPTQRDQEVLRLVLATLRKFTGDYAGAQAELQARSWQTRPLKLLAHRLAGDIAELTNQFDQAIAAYEAGLTTVQTALGVEAVHLRKSMSRVFMRQQDLERAGYEVQVARYEIENIQGNIEELKGKYGAAQQSYEAALAIAEVLGHTQGEAKTRNNLGGVLARLESFDLAQQHWERARDLLRTMGNMAGLASACVNQAFGYNLAGRHHAAIPPAQEALALFQRLGEPTGRAAAAQNLAEAYLALGELALAETYAQHVVAENDALALPDGLRVLGEVKLQQGDTQSADRLIRQSLDVARQNDDPFLEAYALRALAHVYLARNLAAEAATAFKDAITLFQQLELPHEVAATPNL